MMKQLTVLVASLALSGVGLAQDMAAPPNSLVVDDTGNVGVGTDLPDSVLNVVGKGLNGRVKVENDDAVAAKRYLVSLNNNGASGFEVNDSSAGVSWQLATTSSGHFTVSAIGTGGSEFLVRNTGEFVVGPGGVSNFRVAPGGSAVFKGSVTAAGVLLTSDRATKINFREVDPIGVLAKVGKLDISRWNFKSDETQVDHIGPVAQDFHAAFGVGPDDKHISPMDMASVALAAIKGLQTELAQRDDAIAELRSNQVRLESMLQALVINTEAQSLPAVYVPANTGL